MTTWINVAAVGGGAATGAWLRWGLGLWLNPMLAAFPLGTLVANLVGGFLMGVALFLIQAVPELPAAQKLLLTTGFLGGLTTFSSFSGEVFGMLQRQAYGSAGLTITLHVAGSLLATWAGWWCMQAWR
ncbi:fluoride efflux transporter CrcB [Uliginosibacterium sp. H1]|uniref:fluoride efflux transporter CrcB n=1 Tax=Uliginosibacterium sp. H1 TaxID=3114757 RepID=UPI002E177A98|nr:fluoride efflux transporter CrcB [Uliginosibacterium sp. H1]